MKAVLQRVSNASVTIDSQVCSSIERGFLILLGVESGDEEGDAEKLAGKIAALRVFTDENDKMNLSLADIDGSVLVVSNFTLCADCSHGRRPSFIAAARPQTAEPLYERFCDILTESGVRSVKKGVFGADMKVSLLNDGPVTLIIDSKELH